MKTTHGSRRRPPPNEPPERPSRTDDANAFVPDTVGNGGNLPSDDAESAAEEFMASALTGESIGEEARDEVVADEEGGPFIVLDDDAKLPPEPEERGAERDGDAEVRNRQTSRAGRWAARRG